MASAAAEVAAARIVFGTPKDERAEHRMHRWLDTECRDWRFESGAQPGEGRVVEVSVVLAMPKPMQKLRQIIAMHVKRWGFFRRAHGKNMLTPISIDDYIQGPTGDLVRDRVRALLDGAAQKAVERADFLARGRRRRREEKLAKFRETQVKNFAPELRLVLKGLWTNVSMNSGPRREKKGWQSFRDDPVKKRRRLTRGIEYEELDQYDEEGERIN